MPLPPKAAPAFFGVTIDQQSMLKIEPISPLGDRLLVGPSGKPRLLRDFDSTFEHDTVLAVAGIVSLVRQDSLGRCWCCGARQYRRYNFQPDQTIEDPWIPEVNGKSVRVFLPRKANQKCWWKRGLIRKLVMTSSYQEPSGWVRIWPETCCPTPHCDGEEWQVPLGRDGYRKFGPARWWHIRQLCRLMPQTFRMHTIHARN